MFLIISAVLVFLLVLILFACQHLTFTEPQPKNVAELIIYLVKGIDVRHTTMDEIESSVL